MKESFLRVDCPFLPLTSPVPVTFTRFLTCTLRKVQSTSTIKRFCRCSYIFEITTYPLMDKWFPLLALPPNTAPEGWMVQSIADYSLYNISNRISLRRDQTLALYIRFLVFLRWAMHYVSMYFLRRIVFRFLPREKR